jgi:hypothetical protein
MIIWHYSFVNNIIHESMIILLRENHSKLLILYFFLLRDFVTCYSQRHDINYRKSVENINIWSSGWWCGVYCTVTWNACMLREIYSWLTMSSIYIVVYDDIICWGSQEDRAQHLLHHVATWWPVVDWWRAQRRWHHHDVQEAMQWRSQKKL